MILRRRLNRRTTTARITVYHSRGKRDMRILLGDPNLTVNNFTIKSFQHFGIVFRRRLDDVVVDVVIVDFCVLWFGAPCSSIPIDVVVVAVRGGCHYRPRRRRRWWRSMLPYQGITDPEHGKVIGNPPLFFSSRKRG
jgi:hypothetical protein